MWTRSRRYEPHRKWKIFLFCVFFFLFLMHLPKINQKDWFFQELPGFILVHTVVKSWDRDHISEPQNEICAENDCSTRESIFSLLVCLFPQQAIKQHGLAGYLFRKHNTICKIKYFKTAKYKAFRVFHRKVKVQKKYKNCTTMKETALKVYGSNFSRLFSREHEYLLLS